MRMRARCVRCPGCGRLMLVVLSETRPGRWFGRSASCCNQFWEIEETES